MDQFNYKRRETSVTQIGNTPLGGKNPIRVQSMTNTNTNDTEASAEQAIRIIKAGADYVRLTAQGVREAENLKPIKEIVRSKGYDTPLIADIHFNPRAAEAAAKYVEKVRINPGNFVDRVKTFETFSYTDEEYNQEIEKIRAKLIPLLNICKEHHTAIRLGVNHGSLSDRIMSRYGDTPEGMVESCMEFLHICIEEKFFDIAISIKASNTIVMAKTVRLLIDRMNQEDLHFPLHLGVTEAGDGEDGRIKSAVGIGSLLADGIGDTIRVSLSEEPECEVPVARKLVKYITDRENHPKIEEQPYALYNPLSTDRRQSRSVNNIGGHNLPIVISDRSNGNYELNNHFLPDYIYAGSKIPDNAPRAIPYIVDFEHWQHENRTYPLFTVKNRDKIKFTNSEIKFIALSHKDLNDELIDLLKNDKSTVVILKTQHINRVGEQRAFFHRLMTQGCDVPVIMNEEYFENQDEDLQLKAAADIGTLLLDGFGDGVMLQNKGNIPMPKIDAYMFGILQAARVRTSKTEFISCPSCGRTLFDLQTTIAKIKSATSHLTHLKIGIMGCIVNGPGEMADADYGYVGAERGKVTLYKKKEMIRKNIPSDEAVESLIQLIKDNGDWIDPQ